MIKQELCRDIPIDTCVTVLILTHKRFLVAIGRGETLGWAAQAFHSLGSFLIVRVWMTVCACVCGLDNQMAYKRKKYQDDNQKARSVFGLYHRFVM